MAPPKRPWYRMYVESLWDPKLRRSTPAHRWLWVSVLALARSSPISGALYGEKEKPLTLDYIVDAAALKVGEVKKGLAHFVELEMLTVNSEGAYVVTGWDKRQFESDDVSERVRRHRQAKADVTPDETFPGAPDGTFPLSVGLTEVPEVQNSSSSSDCSNREPEPFDDDETPAHRAAKVLAERDLQRRESERGRVGNRTAWLTTARRRRMDEVRAWLDDHGWPLIDAIKLVDLIEPDPTKPTIVTPLGCEDCEDGWLVMDDGAVPCSCQLVGRKTA